MLPLTEALEPAAYGRVQRSPSSPLLPRTFPDGAIAAEPEPCSPARSILPNTISTISSSPSLSNRQDQPTFHAACGDGDNRTPGSEAFSEPTSRQPSVFSVVSPSARTSVTQYSVDTPPAPFHPRDRYSITEGNEDYPTPAGSLRTSQSIQSSSATPQPPMALPPPLRQTMTMHCEIRIWYTIARAENSYVIRTRRNHVVKDIDIVQYSGKGTSEIYLKTADGLNVLHQCSSDISDLAQTILRPRIPPDIARDHPSITCLLKFGGDHSFSARTKEKSYKIFFEGAPEYTFIDDRGMSQTILFQTLQ